MCGDDPLTTSSILVVGTIISEFELKSKCYPQQAVSIWEWHFRDLLFGWAPFGNSWKTLAWSGVSARYDMFVSIIYTNNSTRSCIDAVWGALSSTSRSCCVKKTNNGWNLKMLFSFFFLNDTRWLWPQTAHIFQNIATKNEFQSHFLIANSNFSKPPAVGSFPDGVCSTTSCTAVVERSASSQNSVWSSEPASSPVFSESSSTMCCPEARRSVGWFVSWISTRLFHFPFLRSTGWNPWCSVWPNQPTLSQSHRASTNALNSERPNAFRSPWSRCRSSTWSRCSSWTSSRCIRRSWSHTIIASVPRWGVSRKSQNRSESKKSGSFLKSARNEFLNCVSLRYL